MNQYTLLRKKNDPLNSLIGQSFNQKSKLEAEKILDEIHSMAQVRMIGKKALCYVTENDEIKGVGGSSLMKNKKTGEIVSNLVLDNFGIWLAGMLKGGSLAKLVTLKQVSGANVIYRLYDGAGQFFNTKASFRSLLQVGSGSTAPARADFNIETEFVTSPEDTAFESSVPVFNTSTGNFKNAGSITAGGSGTINESVLKVVWDSSTGINTVSTLFRDSIIPGVGFINGQTITVEYTVQL